MKKQIRSSRDIIIRTKSWKEALKFYRSTLGLKTTLRSKTMAGFETGAFCLYVEHGKDHGPVFEFLTPDLEATKRKLLAAGCIVVEEDPDLPRCYIKDPFGLVFNIHEAS